MSTVHQFANSAEQLVFMLRQIGRGRRLVHDVAAVRTPQFVDHCTPELLTEGWAIIGGIGLVTADDEGAGVVVTPVVFEEHPQYAMWIDLVTSAIRALAPNGPYSA